MSDRHFWVCFSAHPIWHTQEQAPSATALGAVCDRRLAWALPAILSHWYWRQSHTIQKTLTAPASARGRIVSKKTAPIVSSKCTAMSGLGAGSVMK